MFISNKCPCCNSNELRSKPAIFAPFIVARLKLSPLCNTMTCKVCGFVFVDVRYKKHHMKALYKDYRGAEYVALRELHEPGYTARNDKLLEPNTWKPDIEKFVREYIEPETVLDWGGDTGINSPFDNASLSVYDITRKELVPRARRVTRPRGHYDLIVCASVIEHIPNPMQMLKKISSVKHEYIYIDAPRESKRNRVWHEHINYFSRSSMRHLLDRCGLDVVGMRFTDNLLQVVCR